MSEPSPAPSMAEQARTLISQSKVGCLSTLSAEHAGWPFGSVMPYGLDAQGQPTFLISSMAMHTQNLMRDTRASLLITSDEAQRPLEAARITLLGQVTPVPDERIEPVRSAYLARHREAAGWVEFGDFAFYDMAVTAAYYVGGFGVMGWLTVPGDLPISIEPFTGSESSA